MIGTTLNGMYDYLHSLADEDGDYYLVCGRYGDRPVPVADLRFDTRATARAAARATEQYRCALRRYDPQVPYYDVIVCQDMAIVPDDPNRVCCDSTHGTCEQSLSEPVVNSSPVGDRELVEFCHRVAAVVFETLSKHGYDAVESAIMDAYFAHAEELSDPDGLCLRLLESMAVELNNYLGPSEQVTFLSAAASRLEYTAGDVTGSTPRSSGEGSVDESLSVLEGVGLFRRGARVTETEAVGGRSRELVIEVSEYTLRPHDGRLPLLPIALAVHRCDDAWVPIQTDVSDDGCQVVFCPLGDSATLDQVFAPEIR